MSQSISIAHDGVQAEPTVSAYIQCHSNPSALFHTLQSFRTAYPTEPVTLVSDRGDDLSKFARHFDTDYYWSDKKCDPRGRLGVDGTREYLRRIYQHCTTVSSDYVVVLEEDVTTLRRIRSFPTTACAGPRFNGLSPSLTRYLQRLNRSLQEYGYAMCGGSIFDRRVFVRCYEARRLDLPLLARLDPAVTQYSDVALTVIFLVNGYSYSVWDEISEAHHPIEELRIFRDAAFDHNDKRWYGVPFDMRLLERLPDVSPSGHESGR